jgi:hypothetical protein
MKIYFDGIEAPIATFISADKVAVVTPPYSTVGPVDVSVVQLDGLKSTLVGGYTYTLPQLKPAPTITSINPKTGYVTGGDTIYLYGTGFASSSKVTIGGKDASLVSFVSSTKMAVKVPAGDAIGSVDVTVVNIDGQAGTLISGYMYTAPPAAPAPTITNVSPNSGSMSGGDSVYIYGTNLSSSSTFTFGNNVGTVVTFYSSTKVLVKTPKSDVAGTIDVSVTNPDNQSFTLPQSYTYMATTPVISSITPNNGPITGGTAVYINGTNFDTGLTVTVDGQPVAVTFVTSTKLQITTPSVSAAKVVAIVVTNPSGTSSSVDFTYMAPLSPAPTLTVFNINNGPLAGGNIVYLNGTNFKSGMTVWFGNVQAQIVTFYGLTKIAVRVPAGSALGPVNVKVINPDGQESNIITYTYN